VEVGNNDKHSSLLQSRINYEHKMFLGPEPGLGKMENIGHIEIEKYRIGF
jgi:hypothetical protein